MTPVSTNGTASFRLMNNNYLKLRREETNAKYDEI